MEPSPIHLARDGEITRHNYARLGYQRLTRGAYGRPPDVAGVSEFVARRRQYLAHVRAVMTLYAEEGAVLCGSTALQVLGVALPTSVEDWQHVHLAVPRDASRPRRRDVVAHRRTDCTVWARSGGVPVLHPVDAWAQLRGATEDELIEVGDGLMRPRKKPLLQLEQVHQRIDALAGTPGIGPVRRAAGWIRPRTDSLYETRLRMIIVRSGLPEPAVNPPVFAPSVGVWYHVDLAYEDVKVGVEYDGLVHVNDRGQMDFDAERRRDLQDAGWLLFTVTAGQMSSPGQFLGPIERALVLRGAGVRK